MKALIHWVPRQSAGDSFADRLREVAESLAQHPDAEPLIVNTMQRIDDDPFGKETPYRATLEIKGAAPELLERLVSGLADRIDAVAHPDLSTLLVGEEVVFTDPGRAAPIRYQYLMRRNASFSHAAYLERYREIHSQFGLETPGILGYVQFHVDPIVSRRLAQRAGLGGWGVDSVSELHLESVSTFMDAIMNAPELGRDAQADEEIFVDRKLSYDFCSVLG